ncbi:MAG: MBOAT family protein [Clostridia bacterium]|nr:MBOAT family protein [Clostridia bacterium]
MIFNSIEFLIFYPTVLLLYFLLPKRFRWTMLLAASAFFYLYWSVKLIFLILFTIVISYTAAILIERYRERPAIKRTCLIVTLVACFGVLFFFKYFNFLSGTVTGLANLFGAEMEPYWLDLILPVGISFYTFQTLSFVIDVYRGVVPAERHFGYYALYVTFFPQLVAGPIERPENLIPQLHAEHDFSWDNAIPGLRKMIIGFFKKVVVADFFATYVNAVYNAPDEARGLSVLIATMLFAVQIYCDFSGYTDIAIGCAEIMGIKLMQNFDRPYTAASIKEFWNRWHISLSSWFRDYLYFPLGGSRCSRPRHLFNLMVVFLVSGLWHGAAWTFVIWGALHGFYQVVGILLKGPKSKLYAKLGIDEHAAWVRRIRQIITFILVDFAWIFFRANSFADLGKLMRALFTDWALTYGYFEAVFSSMNLSMLTVGIMLMMVLIMNRMDARALIPTAVPAEGKRPALASVHYVYLVWIIAVAWMILLAGDGSSSFIYFQF